MLGLPAARVAVRTRRRAAPWPRGTRPVAPLVVVMATDTLRKPTGRPMRDYTAEERRAEHALTLRTPSRRYGIDARTIFWLEDRVWGPARALGKFKARELVARSPYRAWERRDDPAAAEEAANERAHWAVLRGLLDDDGINEST